MIAGQLYKLGPAEILQRCALEHERPIILSEAHARIVGGHYGGKETMHNILQEGLWWPTMHADAHDYCHSYDVYQRMGKPSRRDEMPLVPKLTLQAFDKWVVDFVGPISLAGTY